MCWPGNHTWSKWVVIRRGQVTALIHALGIPIEHKAKRPVIGTSETQRRECQRCGKAQLRQIRA